MSPEQATTLLDWWQEQSFDGKSLFALSAEGSLTLKEIQDILLKKKLSFNELKATEVKKILLEELSDNNNSEGITLKELANFMSEQGCISAINLDGGGSSSLYIHGKYVNNQVGDKDEASGLAVVRPVSDAIIFKKKQ